jgi:hypothetical protein
MKKLIALGACALLLTLSLEQPASAWLNLKFGAGVNWSWQAGGNNLLCGLYRCGQPPGYGACDPSCLVKGCGQQCMQPQGMMPQQCPPPPWMMQQPFGQQGGAPMFPNMGCQQSNFGDPTRMAYNGNGQTQVSNYSPCSSWNCPGNAPGYYGSSSYYGPYAATSSYYSPSCQASYGYNPGYQAPYNYGYQSPWNYYTGWGYNYGR